MMGSAASSRPARQALATPENGLYVSYPLERLLTIVSYLLEIPWQGIKAIIECNHGKRIRTD